MAQDGEINLGEVKASYSIKDITLIDARELSFINEFRLYYEISFAVGLTVVGSILGSFSLERLIVSVIFIIFGFYNLFRYLLKIRKMYNERQLKNEKN